MLSRTDDSAVCAVCERHGTSSRPQIIKLGIKRVKKKERKNLVNKTAAVEEYFYIKKDFFLLKKKKKEETRWRFK